MTSDLKDQTIRSLDDNERSIDELHRQLAQTPGVDQDKLQKAVDKLKTAHRQFRDDALGCMN